MTHRYTEEEILDRFDAVLNSQNNQGFKHLDHDEALALIEELDKILMLRYEVEV